MKNHNILLFASGYKSSASANGICARNLVREFVHQGHNVYVIAVPHENEERMEIIDGAKVWFEKHDWWTRKLGYFHQNAKNRKGVFLSNFFSLIRGVLLAPLYPNTSRGRVNRIVKLSRKLVALYDIDTVIGTCLPYCGIPAAVQLKKEYGNKLRVVTYHFDILSTPYNSKGLIYYYKQNRFMKAFNEELNIVDSVYLPETSIGLHFHKNIHYIGLPVFLPCASNNSSSYNFPKEFINISYVGSIGGNNRSILPAIDLLRMMNKGGLQKYKLHLWGMVSDGKSMLDIERNSDIVEHHGLIDNLEVHSLLMKSDYLLNISNAILYRLLPSKMFAMFATGKPIINIVFNPNDSSIPFFKRYGNCLFVEMWKDVKDIDLSRLKEHIYVNDAFDNYRPETIARLLLGNS